MKTHDVQTFYVLIIFAVVTYACGNMDKKELLICIILIHLSYILMLLCRIYNKLNNSNE
jgi:hypothetical protein